MKKTSQEYDSVITVCRTLFINKMKDYGSAWRILRLPSLTDQIFIKAQRIRSLQENEVQKVDEGQGGEFIGIINYCVIALIQKKLECSEKSEFSDQELSDLYDEQIEESRVHASQFQAVLEKAAKRFAALARVEERHANHYQQALDALTVNG